MFDVGVFKEEGHSLSCTALATADWVEQREEEQNECPVFMRSIQDHPPTESGIIFFDMLTSWHDWISSSQTVYSLPEIIVGGIERLKVRLNVPLFDVNGCIYSAISNSDNSLE